MPLSLRAALRLMLLTILAACAALADSSDALPPELDAAEVGHNYPVHINVMTKSSPVVPLYVRNARRVLLAVNQTGYGCPASSGSCPNQQITLSASQAALEESDVIQSCGGRSGFIDGEPGESNNCSAVKYCDLATVLEDYFADSTDESSADSQPEASPGGSYSGFLSIGADVKSILGLAARCSYFAASLWISPNEEDVSDPVAFDASFGGFVLHTATPGLFRNTLAVPWSDYEKPNGLDLLSYAATQLGVEDSDLVYEHDLTAVFDSTDSDDPDLLLGVVLYLVADLTVSGISHDKLSSNISFACIMDWITEDYGVCRIPVPSGSNYASVEVAQTYFTPEQNAMTVRYVNNRSETTRTTTCGGSVGFRKVASADFTCDVRMACDAGFLYGNDATMETTPVEFVEIIVPKSVGDIVQCFFTFAALVTFEYRDQAVPKGCEYICKADRECVPASYVCDGQSDCSDSADEQRCYGWQAVENASIFPLRYGVVHNATDTSGQYSFSDCKLLALLQLSNVFALARNFDSCIVYSAANTSALLAHPEQYLVPSGAQFFMYAHLDSISSYPHVTSFAHCSNRGRLANVSAGGAKQAACICDQPMIYSGDNCEVVNTLSPDPALLVVLVLQSGTLASVDDVAISLGIIMQEYLSLTTACGPFFFVDSLLATSCSIRGSDDEVSLFSEELTLALTLNNLNDALALQLLDPNADDSEEEFFDLVRIVVPSQMPKSVPCSVSGECPLRIPTPVTSMTVQYTADITARGLALPVVLTPAETGGRRSAAPSYTVECVPGETMAQMGYRGCLQMNCVMALNGSALTAITPAVPAAVDRSSLCFSPPEVSIQTLISLPALEVGSVVNTQGKFTGTLAAGVVVTGLAVCVLIGSAVFRLRDFSELSERLRLIEVPDSRLKLFLTQTFRVVGHYNSRARVLRIERISVGLAAASFNVLIVGVLVLLYHATSSSYSSNTAIVVEEYGDSNCNASVIAPTAFRYSLLDPDTSRECKQREVFGSAGATFFAAGYCLNSLSGGPAVAHIKGGSSESDCRAASLKPLVSGSCVPIQVVVEDARDLTFLKVTCATAASAGRRMLAVGAIADAGTAMTQSVSPTALDGRLAQHWSNQSLAKKGKYEFHRVSRFVAEVTTSASSCRFESYKDGTDLVEDSAGLVPSRLVLQTAASFAEPKASFHITELEAIEAQLAKDIKRLSRMLTISFAMNNGDYPVGFIYNYFNDSAPVTGAKAGAGAARYYGIRGSFADVGRFFNNDLMKADGEGFTISVNLRLTYESYGFAFAIADARENVELYDSPLLNRLLEVQANGLGDSAWFDNYSVYTSLLVDGPADSLYFMYANPGVNPNTGEKISQRVVKLKWDLRQLGLLSLFNGYWHNVVIKLRAENGQTKAQLMVDGRTSMAALGWNQCVPRRPIGVQALKAAELYPAVSVDNERLTTGGVLFTGYFNGGVANLEFLPENVPLFDLWFASSAAIRARNTIDDVAFVSLGSVLIATACVFFAVSFGTSGLELWQLRKREREDERKGSFALYAKLWLKNPADLAGALYQPMKWSDAKHILRLSSSEFSVFLQQLRYNFRSPPNELVRLLYIFARNPSAPAVDDPPPSAAAWLELLHELQEAASAASVQRVVDNRDEDPQSLEEMVNVVAGASAPMEREHYDGLGPAANPLVSTGGQESSGEDPKKKKKRQRKTSEVSSDAKAADMDNTGTNNANNEGDVQVDTKKATGDLSNKKLDTQFTTHQQLGNSSTITASYATSTGDILAPLITSLQSVYVWLSTLGTVPPEYVFRYQGFFAFFCADWSIALKDLPPIVTPMLQIFGGLAVFAFVIYFLQIDELAFAATLGRYALRRDDIDAAQQGTRAHNYSDDVIQGIDDPLADFDKCDFTFEVPILSLKESQRVDQFLCRTKAQSIENLQAQRTMKVKDDSGNVYELAKREGEFEQTQSTACVDVSCSTAPAGQLRDAGFRCPCHTDQRLRLQQQTNVWPFVHRPSCCAVMNDAVCGASTGAIYRCGAVHLNRHGRRALCPYALCSKHFRAGAGSTVLADILLPFAQNVTEYGTGWLFATVFLFLGNLFYTPFLKTALMILACNPYFQCLLPSCWGQNMDQTFILAVYLSLTVVVFFGVGFPLTLALLLRRRARMLNEIFFAEEYGSRYGDPAAREVDGEEWARFVAMDPTALGTLYKSFEFQRLYVPPIILAWKVVLLCPPVFMENGTLGQAIGVAIVEFSFGLYMFVTAPSINAVVDWMYKLGAVHQMLFLGIHNVNVYLTYNRRPSAAGYLVATTLIYLLVTAAVIIYSKVAPTVKVIRETSTLNNVLELLGMQYTEMTGIFVVPRSDLSFTEVEDDGDGPPPSFSRPSQVSCEALPFAVTEAAELEPQETDEEVQQRGNLRCDVSDA
jgi:hypothetical protein